MPIILSVPFKNEFKNLLDRRYKKRITYLAEKVL